MPKLLLMKMAAGSLRPENAQRAHTLFGASALVAADYAVALYPEGELVVKDRFGDLEIEVAAPAASDQPVGESVLILNGGQRFPVRIPPERLAALVADKRSSGEFMQLGSSEAPGWVVFIDAREVCAITPPIGASR